MASSSSLLDHSLLAKVKEILTAELTNKIENEQKEIEKIISKIDTVYNTPDLIVHAARLLKSLLSEINENKIKRDKIFATPIDITLEEAKQLVDPTPKSPILLKLDDLGNTITISNFPNFLSMENLNGRLKVKVMQANESQAVHIGIMDIINQLDNDTMRLRTSGDTFKNSFNQ